MAQSQLKHNHFNHVSRVDTSNIMHILITIGFYIPNHIPKPDSPRFSKFLIHDLVHLLHYHNTNEHSYDTDK